jgi:hypothetical protein
MEKCVGYFPFSAPSGQIRHDTCFDKGLKYIYILSYSSRDRKIHNYILLFENITDEKKYKTEPEFVIAFPVLRLKIK